MLDWIRGRKIAYVVIGIVALLTVAFGIPLAGNVLGLPSLRLYPRATILVNALASLSTSADEL